MLYSATGKMRVNGRSADGDVLGTGTSHMRADGFPAGFDVLGTVVKLGATYHATVLDGLRSA